ncbi:hypothetical protein FIBSPDRAFT_945996 [Athelia psychrophila]|uniref:Uncharacterized protein n=1 Tax=Athelia psychrophila TaxID=1759441 RepID=A0A166T700_9AGAM|nr:hypothetical protein FIBSPDRAFT_945996 [Fibularhizoctonia sp. CBS 109695]
MDEECEETLVSRRPNRSTAGNRVETAFAELGLEDLTKDIACRARPHHPRLEGRSDMLHSREICGGEVPGEGKGRDERPEEGKGKGDEKWHSRGTHTALNTSRTASRLKATVQRRVSPIPPTQTYTQFELLARALDTDERSIFKKRGYLAAEEKWQLVGVIWT